MISAGAMQIPALLCKNNCPYRAPPMHGLRSAVAKSQQLLRLSCRTHRHRKRYCMKRATALRKINKNGESE